MHERVGGGPTAGHQPEPAVPLDQGSEAGGTGTGHDVSASCAAQGLVIPTTDVKPRDIVAAD